MIQYLVSLSLLILAVLVIRGIFRKTVSPRAIYALWLVVVIRMLLPFTLFEIDVTLPEFMQAEHTELAEDSENPPEQSGAIIDVPGKAPATPPMQTTPTNPSPVTPITPVIPSVTTPATPVTPVIPTETAPIDPITPETDPSEQTLPKEPAVIDWKQITNLIWLCGAVFAAAWVVLLSGVYNRRLYKDRVLHKTVGGTKVYISESAGVPCIAGFIPSIYITPETANSKSEMMVVIHERTHMRHGDHIWSIVRALALIVFWWNPLVWIAATVSKQDAELACDDAVSAKLSDDDRLKYANILLDTIPQKHRYAVGLGSAPMKERIIMLAERQKNRIICLILAATLAFSAVGCAFVSLNEKEKDDTLTETKLPDNFIEFYYEAERAYALFTGYGDNIYTNSTFSENGANYRSVDINGYTTLEELRSHCEQYFSPELTDELMSITVSSEQHPLFREHDGKLYKFGGYVAIFAFDADGEYDMTLEGYENGKYTVRVDATMTENNRKIPVTAHCTYTLTENGEIRFDSFELMAIKMFEALNQMPIYREIPSIVLTQIDALPYSEDEALFSASPVGENPTIIFFDDSLKFYFINHLSGNDLYEYFTGTLTLPEGFTDAKIIQVKSGAGSGEIFVSAEAMRNGEKEYLTYGFFGMEAPSGVDVLNDAQTERLLEEIGASPKDPIVSGEFTVVYTRYGINVALSGAYLGNAVTYIPDYELPDNFIAEFYQTAIMDDNAGWLFSIVRHSENELLSEKTNHAGFNYFAHDSEYWYGVMVPTDVQLDLTSEELTKEYQDLFAQKDLVVQAILEANSLLTPASNEDAYKRYSEIHLTTQGPFIGYVASKDTPWIDLYTEVNGTWVAKIPYEIFNGWPATDRDSEWWTPGWESEYMKYYYAEFGDFCWAAVHLGDTVLGNGRKNIATSADGGKTWNCGSYMDDYGGNHVVGIGFASENVAFMSFDPHNEHEGADGPVISRTVDGGKTWELLDIPVPPSLKGKKLIAGIPYYSRNELFYPVWLNTSHGKKEGEPMYLVSRDKGLTWSWDRYSLPAEMTQYVVDIPMEDERDFITVAGVYGKGAEPGYPDGATIHAGKDGTLYFVMGVGNDWWSRGNFKALRTYRVTSKSGYLESVEEVETFTKNKVLKSGKPYTGELDGMFTCQAYRFIQGNFNYDFWSHSIYIQSDGSIFANVGMVGTGGPINYEGTYQYDEKTGDFTAKLVGRYASNGEVDIYPESEVKGKLYEYGGFVHFVCESSEVSTLTVNDPIPLTFVPNTDGYADPPTLVLDNEFDGVWESCFGNSSGDYLYRLSIVTESAQIQFDDIKNDSSYVGTYTVNPLNHTQTATLRSLNASAKEDEFTIKFSLGYVKGEGETWLCFDVRACDAPSLQHIVGYTLVFEDNTAISTAYTTENIFNSILENKQSFYDVSSKESMLLSEYKAKTDYSIKRYAILDLNKDRDPEMVLWLGYYENDYLGFLVLHRDGDTVYAHDFPYRGMNGLRRDGGYLSSTSAFNMSIVRLDFNGDTYTENVLARREGDGSFESIRHYIGEKEVTKQEFLEYYDRYDSSGIPDWYSYDIEEITDIDDWDSLIWAEWLPEDENKHPAQHVYSFIRKLVKGEANIPELNGLGIKDYSIAILSNSSFDSQIRFNFTVTGNSLPETLPPGTYSWRLLDGMDLYIYRDKGPGETVNIGRAHSLNEFGEYSAAQAVDTYLCWMPYVWEVSPYGEWDMTNYNLPYNYICAYYGENLEIDFGELQKLMAEKFGITVERPADGVLHSWRCEYNKANDTVGYADTRGYEPVHEIIDVREDGDVTYVTVQLFADRLYLVPSHKVVYKIGEGDVFLGYEIAETGRYEPREFELNGGGDY